MGFERMLGYCAALEAHNERPWFHENHKWYEEAKADYLNLLDLVRFSIAENAPAMAEDILYMQPKDWMYRVARDARTNRGKPPYDPSFRAYLSRDRKSWRPIGYFLCIGPGDISCFGTGIWCENAASAGLVRDHILANFSDFQECLKTADTPFSGSGLKRMPRGYEQAADTPAAEYLRRREWSLIRHFPDSSLTDMESFDAAVRECVRRFEPMRQFLLEASTPRSTDESQKVREFYSKW